EDSPAVQSVLRWLVVVDNADDLTWGVNGVIPKGMRGNVVITSQDDQSPKLLNRRCEKLRVDIMELLEARALLLQHLKWDLDSAPQDVLDICATIVGRLGCLALAIDLAGAYIGNNSDQEVALRQYLADYSRHRDALLRNDYFQGLSSYDKT